VVGDSDNLGRWDVSKAVRLSTSPDFYPIWTSNEVEQALAAQSEFKFVIVYDNDEVCWEEGPNRKFVDSAAEDRFGRVAIVAGVLGKSDSTRVSWPLLHPVPRPFASSLTDVKLGLPSDGTVVVASWPAEMAAGQFAVSNVDLLGSFTQPPWSVRVPLRFCQNTMSWWTVLEEVLCDIEDGEHKCKFLINGDRWMLSSSLTITDENNLIYVDSKAKSNVGCSGAESLMETASTTETTNHGRFDSIDEEARSDCCWSASELCEWADGDEEGLELDAGGFCIPKANSGDGEDSHFIEARGTVGVADGVGGLMPVLGHSSKMFADELMQQCAASAAHRANAEPEGEPSLEARGILCDGYATSKANGASTAAIAHLNKKTGKLGVAILGDSAVLVVRYSPRTDGACMSMSSSLAFKSPSQQHSFNYPYQLCRLPPRLMRKLTVPLDLPSDCITFDFTVQDGDLILVVSDGVLDNLHDHEILELCDALSTTPDDATRPEEVARMISQAAYERSVDATAKTPFSVEAINAGQARDYCCGGKEDDITCVAAWVTSAIME